MNSTPRRGFTIVELLIVIVVIGILAVIAIVAYNGIQVRARNSQVASAIQSYKKAFTQYAIEHQAYPTTTSACLGTDYPDTGAYTVANGRSCFRSNSVAGIINTSFNNEIKPYLSNTTPTPNNIIIGDGSGSYPWTTRGAVFLGSSAVILNGTANPWVIVYTLEGQTPCPVGPILDLANYPNATVNPTTGYTLPQVGGKAGVECWLALPDPAKM